MPAGAGDESRNAGPSAAARYHEDGPDEAAEAVTRLYQAHLLSLTRLAHIMLGDLAAAEDVVQEAFCGLYRRWHHLTDTDKALGYVRSSVLNGCRSAVRHRPPADQGHEPPPAVSAETTVMAGEERREIMRAIRGLPPRQREVLVLRYYLDLPEAEIAAVMGIGSSTVRSATHRAIASPGRALREGP
jgi:RNA polymerase sigma-70 factor (sigma-E family)